ncbi:MAG: ABC transporter ATP-binding protein [Planctomycetota bacterium]|jgi:putative ABC transport system ATP-binding protein
MAVLEISGLKKSYVSPEGEQTPILHIPEFQLDEGGQVALHGSSGSGKTTFLNLISGVLRADEGRIVVAGHEITRLSEAERDRVRAQHIGYVFQTFNLLQGYTALENVMLGMMFGNGADRAKAAALLERVGLEDRMNYRPRQLSVGQQQRVAVARALANRPELVLADEPTGNLDARRTQDALVLMREVCRENSAALLFVSHDDSILRQFDLVRELSEINDAHLDPGA